MPNMVITSTTNRIKVDFGDYSTHGKIDATKGSFPKRDVGDIYLRSDHIDIFMKGGEPDWHITNTDSVVYFKVDSVDGASPTSLEDLYNKINALCE